MRVERAAFFASIYQNRVEADGYTKKYAGNVPQWIFYWPLEYTWKFKTPKAMADIKQLRNFAIIMADQPENDLLNLLPTELDSNKVNQLIRCPFWINLYKRWQFIRIKTGWTEFKQS